MLKSRHCPEGGGGGGSGLAQIAWSTFFKFGHFSKRGGVVGLPKLENFDF